MASLPHGTSFDSTLALARDPYRFIARECRTLGSDVFQTRLMLRPTICMTGRDAAELFYDPSRFVRHGAAPLRLQLTLFGKGGVQSLDGHAHRVRKELFMSLMTPTGIEDLVRIADRWWETLAARWASRERVVLYDALNELFLRSACEWAGVPVPEDDVPRRTRDVTALFDHAGDVGPSHWWSRLARVRAERWLADWIRDVRAGHFRVPRETAAHAIAFHRDERHRPLPPRVAAVELLNVIRPTVAVSVYVTFAASALYRYPAWRTRVDDPERLDAFVQEVRRFYPFFPAVVARVRESFEWRGWRFPRGMRTMLDLYGTDHDPRRWADPEAFAPQRFLGARPDGFAFVPQGGGDHMRGHRCPGEWITVALMKGAVRMLTRRLRYDVPEQDLDTDFARLPALPRSRFVMANVGLVPVRSAEAMPLSSVRLT